MYTILYQVLIMKRSIRISFKGKISYESRCVQPSKMEYEFLQPTKKLSDTHVPTKASVKSTSSVMEDEQSYSKAVNGNPMNVMLKYWVLFGTSLLMS